MTDRVVKVIGHHRKNCCGIKNELDGTWDTCWGPLAFGDYGDPILVTERRYGKLGRRYKYWIRFVCNDPDCKAELHVDSEWIRSGAEELT